MFGAPVVQGILLRSAASAYSGPGWTRRSHGQEKSSYEEQHANWLDRISGFNDSFLALACPMPRKQN